VTRLVLAWDGFWYRPAAPAGLVAIRRLVCLHAAWIVLSRFDLPQLAGWPPAFWSTVPAGVCLRYGIFPGWPLAETAAYGALVLALLAGVVGFRPRMACFSASVLLYHFAPFEDILIAKTGPHYGGLTLSVLGLGVLAAAPPPIPGAPPGPEYRWPVVLIRALVAVAYLSSGIAKLRFTGLHWMSPENIQATAALFMTYEARPPWAHWLAGSRLLAGAVGAGTLLLDLSFVLALFSRVAARILIPLALAAQVVAYLTFGLAFLDAPLLLTFVDWDRPRRANGPVFSVRVQAARS
jgi:hypothetical protein